MKTGYNPLSCAFIKRRHRIIFLRYAVCRNAFEKSIPMEESMVEFFVGLLVLALISLLSVLGILLLPLFLVLGFFLRILVGILLLLFLVWLVGKATLILIRWLVKPGSGDADA